MSNHELLDALVDLPEPERLAAIRTLTEEERKEFRHHWQLWGRTRQLPPPGDWTTWLILAGRGFGKTRAGAEWVRTTAQGHPEARIALVGASLGEVRAVMVEDESGILAVCPPGQIPSFEPSLRRLTWGNGTPADGQSWLIAANPTGALSGQAGMIAARIAGNWLFLQPLDGMWLLNKANSQQIRFQAGWHAPAKPVAPSGGTTVDDEARTAIAAIIAALVSAGIVPPQLNRTLPLAELRTGRNFASFRAVCVMIRDIIATVPMFERLRGLTYAVRPVRTRWLNPIKRGKP